MTPTRRSWGPAMIEQLLRTPFTDLVGSATRSCRPAWAGPGPRLVSGTANAGGSASHERR